MYTRRRTFKLALPTQRWVILPILVVVYLSQCSYLNTIHVDAATSGFPGTITPPKKEHSVKSSRKKSVTSKPSTSSGSTQNEKNTNPFTSDVDEDSSSSSEYDLDLNNNTNSSPLGSTENGKTGKMKKIATVTPTGKKKLNHSSKNNNDNDNANAAQIGQPPSSSSYQPLRTLKKLQAMLDETDYATSAGNKKIQQEVKNPSFEVIQPHVSSGPQLQQDIPLQVEDVDPEEDEMDIEDIAEEIIEDDMVDDGMEEFEILDGFIVDDNDDHDEEPKQLWTSKDRSKYRKQQRNLQQKKNQQQQHQQGSSSDDDGTTDDTDGDGLGYTLPNLPVFFSDGEETESDGTSTVIQKQYTVPRNTQSLTQQQYMMQQQQQQYLQQQRQLQPQQNQQQAQQRGDAVPYPYQMPPGYNYNYPLPRPYQGMPSQYQNGAAHYNQNPYAPPYWYPPPPQHQQQTQTTGYPPYYYNDARRQIARPMISPYEQKASSNTKTITNSQSKNSNQQMKQPGVSGSNSYAPTDLDNMLKFDDSRAISLAEAGTMINFDSLQKLTFVILGVMLLAYCAVSPRSLPIVDYNMKFKENIEITSLVIIVPLLISISVFDTEQNDVNACISTFYTAFTVGYILSFVLEIIATTFLRLLVFSFSEPAIFQLTPEVPSLVLPWVLRENKYRPKRITLFAADFVTSCVASPIIEEYIKLKVVQWSISLPRNFKLSAKKKDKKGKTKKRIRELIARKPGEAEVTNINTYVTHMLAASLGLKLCDSCRRILMYTKSKDENKRFYAICRGTFPVHELCGTMTSLELAKRDVLGIDMPLWRILAPAAFIHGMANFRGMKPIFKWNSSTPWSEMQLNPWNMADNSTLKQLLSKGFTKLIWLSILVRVLGYCIKNYYLITRKAVKRATTFAGKQAAFSAELAATDVLKKSKTKKGRST